jgi:glycosyltransferase involved in cell wall biosynthesis
VPPAGGIGELVTDGINGYKINARDTKNLTEKIIKIFSDEEHYYKMSVDAKLSSKKFDYKTMIDSIERILT